MEERTDQPMFDLFLDQQVFMDAVHGNERIDQYSAYTEVTTFEQRGDELRLEGHILVAAYLERDGEANAQVEHVEHRLPFEVTVPVYAQVPGMLNVKVQVPELDLEILGPGWLHLEALLLVEGLSSEGGVTVTCGAQEFRIDAQDPEGAEEVSDTAITGAAIEAPEAGPPAYVVFESDESLSESGWKKQLQGADRAFHGAGEIREEMAEPAPKEAEESMSVWEVPADFSQRVESPLSMRGEAEPQEREPTSESRSDLAREEQVPVFPEPIDTILPFGKVENPSPLVSQETGVPSASYTALPEQAEPMTAAEWFWKTLSIPDGETRYTLKYRIVQAEESLEEIAGYYRVQLTELMAVNHLQSGYASPGDILYIPGLF